MRQRNDVRIRGRYENEEKNRKEAQVERQNRGQPRDMWAIGTPEMVRGESPRGKTLGAQKSYRHAATATSLSEDSSQWPRDSVCVCLCMCSRPRATSERRSNKRRSSAAAAITPPSTSAEMWLHPEAPAPLGWERRVILQGKKKRKLVGTHATRMSRLDEEGEETGLPMCILKRVCTICHVLWSIIYIGVGAVQFVIGLFFIISLSMLKVGSNIWTGAWNIFIGILSSMLACSGEFTPIKQEGLIFLTISILAINTINIVVLEIGEWYLFMTDDMKELINQKSLNNIVFYARMTTSISTGVAILASFLDSQFTFCSMQKAREPKNTRETISDIEYIMPRKQGTPMSNQGQAVHGNYAQSWVFDMDSAGPQGVAAYLKTSQVPSDESNKAKEEEDEEEEEEDETSDSGEEVEQPQNTFVKPTVHVEPASDESCSGRQLNYMKSFSRTPSPVGVSESSSQESEMNHPAIYECLERICEPEIYAAHLSAAKAVIKERPQPTGKSAIKGMERTSGDGRTEEADGAEEGSGAKASSNFSERLITPHTEGAEKVQYASLMLELQQKIRSKKKDTIQTIIVKGPSNSGHPVNSSVKSRDNSRGSSLQDSPQDSSQKTDQKDSDTEFSRELEAALQFLQDLESPNTIDTPSETCRSIDGAEVPPISSSRRGSACPVSMTVKWRDSLSDHSLEETARRASNRLSLSPPKDNCGNASAGVQIQDSQGEVEEGAVPSNGKEAHTSFNSSTTSGVERSGEKLASDSSSGYSSPSATTSKLPTPYCSKPSSAHSSTNNLTTADDQLSYVISEKGSTAVISLFSVPKGDEGSLGTVGSKKPKGILQMNLVKEGESKSGSHSRNSTGLYKNIIRINGESNTSNTHKRSHRQYLPHTETISEVVSREEVSLAVRRNEENNVSLYDEAIASGYTPVASKSDQNVSSSHDSSRWNMRSLLGKKTHCLVPELKNAIVQSESLAYLSELELLARHSRIKSEQRQIEQRVHQKLFGSQPEESDC